MERKNLKRRTGSALSRKGDSKARKKILGACDGCEYLKPMGWKFRCGHPVVREELALAGSLTPGVALAKAYNNLFHRMALKLRGDWVKDHWPTMFNPGIVENCGIASKSEINNSNL